MPSPTPGPYPYATQTLPGLVSTDVQTFGGIKTFATTIEANDGLTLLGGQLLLGNATALQPLRISPQVTTGTSYDKPAIWLQTTGTNQTYLFQIGSGLTNSTWEFAIGYYTGALTPVISTRASALLISLPSGQSMSPFTPNLNDLGSSGNYWRNLYLSSFSIVGNLASTQLSSISKVMYLYSTGTSGITETVRLVSSRGDAGLKCVTVGTEQASPSSTAVLFQVAKGITSANSDAGNGTACLAVTAGTQPLGFVLSAPGTGGTLTVNNSVGTILAWNAVSVALDSNNIVGSANNSVWARSNGADGAAAVAAYSHSAATWSNATARLHVFRNNSAEVAQVMASGRLDQSGTDSTAAPGAATINKPTGKSSILNGNASVVITNSTCTAASRIMITPHARDATCKELIAVPAAGSFTVSGTAAATADLPFSWEVSNIL